MKGILSVKTLFRSWIKTVFTFILIAAVTFAFFSQTAEYVNTRREFESNVDMYYGSGMVEVSSAKYKNIDFPYYIEADPRVDAYPAEEYNEMGYAKITEDMVKQIDELKYISKTYKRYMTAGICDNLYRKNDNGSYDYAARLIVEGTLVNMSVPNTLFDISKLTFNIDNC